MVHLENWSLRNKYYGFDLETGFLEGVVTGHKKITDGSPIETTSVMFIDTKLGFARTLSGTIYTLGKVNPEYESWIQQYASR